MTSYTIDKGRMAHLPTLSLAERDRRWEALRRAMAEKGLDAIALWGTDVFMGYGMANFRYLTQIGGHHGGVAVFPLEGKPIVYNAPPHEHRPFNAYLTAQNWIDEIRPNRGVASLIEALRELGLERGRIGLVGYRSALATMTLPYPAYQQLVSELPGAHFEDQTALVEQLRMIKSQEEIDLIARAGRIARKTVDRMIEVCREGVRESEVFAEMLRVGVAEGGEPQLFNMLTSGPVDSESGGWRYLLHGIAPPNGPTNRVLRRGDVVVTEFHCSVAGYLSATEFSVFIGKAPDPIKRIHDVQVQCLLEALPMFKPGVRLKDLWEAVRRPCIRAGLDFVELGFHGHGLASPEFPTVVYKPGEGPLDGTGLEDFVLQENMVFGNNIDIYDPSWKPDVGLMFGDTVVVTPDGGRRLCDIPLELPEL